MDFSISDRTVRRSIPEIAVGMTGVAEKRIPEISIDPFVFVAHVCFVVGMAVGAGKFPEVCGQVAVRTVEISVVLGIDREIVVENSFRPI